MYSSQRNRLVTSRRDNTQSKHSPGVAAAAADWTQSTSPSYNSGLVVSHHHYCTSPSYMTLQYQPQRRRRKLSEPDYAGGTRTAFVDARRSLHASQSQTDAAECHADVTDVRYCMTSCGNTDVDWPEI